jgi:hypothetical protein
MAYSKPKLKSSLSWVQTGIADVLFYYTAISSSASDESKKSDQKLIQRINTHTNDPQ